MKFQFTLLLILAIQAVFTNVCDPATISNVKAYSCENKLKDNKCAVTEQIATKPDIVHVRDICGKDEYCNGLICTKREFKKLHGEKCYVNPECYSNVCTDGKCVGLDEGKTCSQFQCKPNLSCQGLPATCKKLVAADGACSADSDCVFNHACGTKTKDGEQTCIKMFSIETGSYSSNGLLCKSGYIYDKGNQEEGILEQKLTGNDWLCSESTSEMDICTTHTDCSYKVGSDTKPGMNGDCECGGKGLKGYCMLGTKDPVFQEFLTLYADKVEGMEFGEDDHIEYLRAIWWGLPKLIQARNNIRSYQVLKDIDKCAIRLVTGSKWINVSGLITILVITLF